MSAVRTAIVTGANSGIGLETARGLAQRGFHVELLCRDPDRAAAAKADIDFSVVDASTDIVLCDLGIQADVRRAATEIASRLDRLDVVVNNAAVQLRRPERTSEGHDVMLATNHLGPFLLTNLLTGLLAASAPSRVVTVASRAHRMGRLDLDDLEARRGYGLLGFPRYCETKLMNILFTRELARRLDGTGVVAHSLHPGAVRTNLGNPPWLAKRLLDVLFLDAEAGAATSLAVATDERWAGVTGRYADDGEPADGTLSAQARSDHLAQRLWAASEALVGETFSGPDRGRR